jgi:hypothetical protein
VPVAVWNRRAVSAGADEGGDAGGSDGLAAGETAACVGARELGDPHPAAQSRTPMAAVARACQRRRRALSLGP